MHFGGAQELVPHTPAHGTRDQPQCVLLWRMQCDRVQHGRCSSGTLLRFTAIFFFPHPYFARPSPGCEHARILRDKTEVHTMADIQLIKPQAGQRTEAHAAATSRLVLEFNANEALLDRQGDDLTFQFEDGAVIVLKDFYAEITQETLPDFLVGGDVVTGKDFFAALSEELQPAAGPATSPATSGGRFHDYAEAQLMGGVDQLGSVDIASAAGGQGPSDAALTDPSLLSERLGGGTYQPGAGPAGPGAPDINTPPYFTEADNTRNYDLVEAGVDAAQRYTAGVATASGNLAAHDDNPGDSVLFFLINPDGSQAQSIDSPYGSFTLNPDGTFSFTLDNDAAATNALTGDDAITLTFTVGIQDSRGLHSDATRTITVNIAGTNDHPEITQLNYQDANGGEHVMLPDSNGVFVHGGLVKEAGVVKEGDDGNVPVEGQYVLKGSFVMDDVDSDDDASTLQYGGQGVGEAVWSAKDATGNARGPVEIQGKYGTLTLNPDGSYEYAADQSRLNILNEGQKESETFSIFVKDSHGAMVEQKLGFNIEGTNDAPTISGKDHTEFLESNHIYTDEGLIWAGKYWYDGATGEIPLRGQDIDGDDSPASLTYFFVGEDGKIATNPDGSYATTREVTVTLEEGGQMVTKVVGSITINPNGTYSLKYDDGAANFLSGKDVVVNDFHIGVQDSHDAFALNADGTYQTQHVEVYVKGKNDKPMFVTEENGTEPVENLSMKFNVDAPDAQNWSTNGPEATGQLFWNDVDRDDDPSTLRYGLVCSGKGAVYSPEGAVGDDRGTVSLNGTYGNLTLYPDGTYKYTVLETDATKALHFSQRGQDFFTILVWDKTGASSEMKMQFRVYGGNDAPDIDGQSTVEFTESGLIPGGSEAMVGGVRVDAGEMQEKQFFHEGKLNASDVDNKHTLTCGFIRDGNLSEDTSQDITYTYMEDGQEKTVTIGRISIDNATGTYKAELFDDAANILPEGETLNLTYHIGVRDDYGVMAKNEDGSLKSQDVTIIIKGTNDAPEFNVDDANWKHDVARGTELVEGSALAVDPDAGDQAKLEYYFRNAQGEKVTTLTTTEGTITITDQATGAYAFTPDAAYLGSLALGDTAHPSYTVYVKDPSGAEVSKDIAFALQGGSSAPQFIVDGDNASVLHLDVVKDPNLPHMGTLRAEDADTPVENLRFSFGTAGDGSPILSMTGTYGVISMDPVSGEYTYTVIPELVAKSLYTKGDGFFTDTLEETFPAWVSDGQHNTDASITVTLDGFGKSANILLGNDLNNTISAGEGDDLIYGGAGNDNLYGYAGDDIIAGGAGNDTVLGAMGNDFLFGGDGNDSLGGGTGDDFLFGGAGNDFLSGDEGNDFLDGGEGKNWLFGGTGNDILKYSALNGTMNGGEGTDFLVGLTPGEQNLDDLLSATAIKGIEAFVFNGETPITSLKDLADMGVSLNETGKVKFDEGWTAQKDANDNPIVHQSASGGPKYVIMELDDGDSSMQIAVQQQLLSEGHG